MQSWVHVWGTAVCMNAELGACLGNGCLHVCGIRHMFWERLFACMRNWAHVWGVGCMSGERSLACLRSWVRVWEQGAFQSPQAGPGPWPKGSWPRPLGPVRAWEPGPQFGIHASNSAYMLPIPHTCFRFRLHPPNSAYMHPTVL